jgi:hypothetical protein
MVGQPSHLEPISNKAEDDQTMKVRRRGMRYLLGSGVHTGCMVSTTCGGAWERKLLDTYLASMRPARCLLATPTIQCPVSDLACKPAPELTASTLCWGRFVGGEEAWGCLGGSSTCSPHSDCTLIVKSNLDSRPVRLTMFREYGK